MFGWHHQLNGHEFEQAPGVGDGQGSLPCCSPWGCKESDMTELKNIPQFVVIHTVKDTHYTKVIVNEADVDVFVEFPCFLYDTTIVSNLISGSSAFFKPSLYIWKFSVHVLMKPSLKDFEYNITGM